MFIHFGEPAVLDSGFAFSTATGGRLTLDFDDGDHFIIQPVFLIADAPANIAVTEVYEP